MKPLFMGDFSGRLVNVERTKKGYVLNVRTPHGYTINVKPINDKHLPKFGETVYYKYGFGGPKEIIHVKR